MTYFISRNGRIGPLPNPLACEFDGSEDANTVKLLLEKGAAPNAADQEGHTPLYYAKQHSRIDAIRLLEGKGSKN